MAKRALAEMSTLALVRAGESRDPNEMLYKPPSVDERKREALITLSSPKKSGHWLHPSRFSRQEFAEQVAIAYDGAGYNGKKPPTAAIMVAKEPHEKRTEEPGLYHYHAIVTIAFLQRLAGAGAV